MKIVSVFFIILFILSSCGKEKQISKELPGEWEPVSLRINEKNGIAEYVDATGFFKIISSSKKSNKGTYSLEISYVYLGQNKMLIENGSYQVRENNFLRTTDLLANHEASVYYLSDQDLEFDIPSLNDQRFLFFFKKK
jgi:isopentenyldiphosphate isomerase